MVFYHHILGHTAKVFHVRWSPLREGVLCSGSDDWYVAVVTTGSMWMSRDLPFNPGLNGERPISKQNAMCTLLSKKIMLLK